MATIRLIPSTYYLSSTQYLNVANESSMYSNTDSTNYATVTNSRTQTTSYYIYLRGFNFSDVPSSAVVTSFTIKLKAYESGVSTSSSYAPMICGGTTTLTGSCPTIGTSAQILTFTGITSTWNEISGYGDSFGIRINCRRASRYSSAFMYIYGAEIDVEYELSSPRSITSTLNGEGTIDPSGTTQMYDGSTYSLTITPTDNTSSITVTNNGIDVSSQIVAHYPGGTHTMTATSYTTGGSFYSGRDQYLANTIGYSAERPTSYSQSIYSSGTNVTAYGIFSFDMSSIPSNATIEGVEIRCCGKRESETTGSYYIARIGLYAGDVLKSTEEEFTSTSDQVITIADPGTWTLSELQNAKLRFTVGYYGGFLFGISWDVTYSIPGSSGPEYYTYTYTVNGDATIAVTIGGSSQTTYQLYRKVNGTWQLIAEVASVYVKSGGSWVEQNDPTSAFDDSTNYVYVSE